MGEGRTGRTVKADRVGTAPVVETLPTRWPSIKMRRPSACQERRVEILS
jgi:hypothetical protein